MGATSGLRNLQAGRKGFGLFLDWGAGALTHPCLGERDRMLACLLVSLFSAGDVDSVYGQLNLPELARVEVGEVTPMRISSCALLSTSQTRVAAPPGRQTFDKPLTRCPRRLPESSLGPARPRCAVKKDESSLAQSRPGSMAAGLAGLLKP